MSAVVKVRWCRAGGSARGVAILLLSTAFSAAMLVKLYPQCLQYLTGGQSFCLMKQVAGIPCLACRGTRCAIALAQGKVGQAFAFNPLATLFFLVVGFLLLAIAITGRIPDFTWDPAWKKLGIVTLIFALLGNWIYVIAAGG